VSVRRSWDLLDARSLTYLGELRGTATGTALAANPCVQLRITLAVRSGTLRPPKPPKAIRSTFSSRASSDLCALTMHHIRGGHNHKLGLNHPSIWLRDGCDLAGCTKKVGP